MWCRIQNLKRLSKCSLFMRVIVCIQSPLLFRMMLCLRPIGPVDEFEPASSEVGKANNFICRGFLKFAASGWQWMRNRLSEVACLRCSFPGSSVIPGKINWFQSRSADEVEEVALEVVTEQPPILNETCFQKDKYFVETEEFFDHDFVVVSSPDPSDPSISPLHMKEGFVLPDDEFDELLTPSDAEDAGMGFSPVEVVFYDQVFESRRSG